MLVGFSEKNWEQPGMGAIAEGKHEIVIHVHLATFLLTYQ